VLQCRFVLRHFAHRQKNYHPLNLKEVEEEFKLKKELKFILENQIVKIKLVIINFPNDTYNTTFFMYKNVHEKFMVRKFVLISGVQSRKSYTNGWSHGIGFASIFIQSSGIMSCRFGVCSKYSPNHTEG